jgi:hypothetical protein
MPKPRSIDPSFWDDPDIAQLTRDERLLLIGMITLCADDEGRLLADPGYLRKRVFGYDDDVSKQDAEAWRNDVVLKCRNVKLYMADSQPYMWFSNWQEYQNIRYVVASKLPEYAPECEIMPGNGGDCGNLPQISVISPRVGLGLSKGSVDAAGTAQAPATPTPISVKPSTRRKLTSHPIPPDFAITDDMRQRAKRDGLPQWVDLDKHTARFIEYWTVGEGGGKPKKNWELTWLTWMRSEAEKAQARGARVGGSYGSNRQDLAAIRPTTISGPDRTGLRDLLEEGRQPARGA